ncbi:hypothetical protein PN462_05180 [Spirulina sp. CS-785/01]|uniref:hypothetical protein n=1 Tax=Spirulina sp. CS-785/01 TaxID=3021716 RepID=UPI00232A9C08|nr:hypothetical protein [Spirulina sp. CS-785/01]MDB9312489.1 hypothetical protein [Spirulina sp. CS-785/01]
MQVVINVPDNLSQAKVKQIIQEFEQRLKEEAELVTYENHVNQLLQWCDEHSFTLEGDVISSREERNAR